MSGSDVPGVEESTGRERTISNAMLNASRYRDNVFTERCASVARNSLRSPLVTCPLRQSTGSRFAPSPWLPPRGRVSLSADGTNDARLFRVPINRHEACGPSKYFEREYQSSRSGFILIGLLGRNCHGNGNYARMVCRLLRPIQEEFQRCKIRWMRGDTRRERRSSISGQ